MASQAAKRRGPIEGPSPKGRGAGNERPATGPWAWDLPLVLILLASAALRLLFLDYSHFQGDEIKALYSPGARFPDFLLAQKKGPVQFLITRMVLALTGGYVEWQTRLPFSLAGWLCVYVVYRMVSEEFGRRAGLLAAALIGSCGLLVAFGRIIQYQVFTMLFILLTAALLFGFLRRGDPRLLYPGLLSYGLALLTHYDALTFGPTLALFLALPARRRPTRMRPYGVHLALATALMVFLVGLFYLPYLRQPHFSLVRNYLLERVASGQGIGTFTATRELLALYVPPFYLSLTIPLLVIGVLVVIRRKGTPEGVIIPIWFVTTFAFYMLFGGDPRSHVYNYFLPGLILVAIGIDKVIGSKVPLTLTLSPDRERGPKRDLLIPTGERQHRRDLLSPIGGEDNGEGGSLAPALTAAAWAMILVFAGITYYMVVDHTVEHPWDRKTVFGYELPNLVTRRVEGVFGFPYRRGLDQVGALFRSGRLQGSFDSNERDVMADYYFQTRRSSNPDYYLFVLRPLSLDRALPAVVARSYRRIGTITERGRPAIEIYEAPWRAASAQGGAT